MQVFASPSVNDLDTGGKMLHVLHFLNFYLLKEKELLLRFRARLITKAGRLKKWNSCNLAVVKTYHYQLSIIRRNPDSVSSLKNFL